MQSPAPKPLPIKCSLGFLPQRLVVERLRLDAHDEEATALEVVDGLMKDYATTRDVLTPAAAEFGAKLRALSRSWSAEPTSKYERMVFVSLLLDALRLEIGMECGSQTWDDLYSAVELVRGIIGRQPRALGLDSGERCHKCGAELPPKNSGFSFCPVCDV